jgi:hypothetical protein
VGDIDRLLHFPRQVAIIHGSNTHETDRCNSL